MQATRVIEALEDYAKLVPEVPLKYSEDEYGIIVLVPTNFNDVEPIPRAVAYAEIENLMVRLTILQTNPRIQVGTHVV